MFFCRCPLSCWILSLSIATWTSTEPYLDFDAGSAQPLKAPTCDQRIGVCDRGNHPGDAG